jgi:nucleoside-diphosphate-sugar epimerase
MNTKPSNDKKAERVLVTGGGGFLGSSIVRRLVDRGDQVRSLARNFYPALDAMGVEQIQGNISDPAAVDKACRGMDVVLHAAAKPPPWGKYDDYYQTNVVGTQNVIEACLHRQVSRLIFTSTPSVIFNGSNLEGVDESFPYPAKYKAYYPATKAMAEKRVVQAANQGLNTIILRPHEIWGPGDPHFVPRLLARAKKLKQIGDGKNLIDTIYIDNAAQAHILAADKLMDNPRLSGKIYFISQDEPVPAWDMINAILKAAGYEPVKGQVPFRAAWLIGAILEFFYKSFPISGEPQMTRFLAEAVATSHWFNIEAAKRDLGYQPHVSTAEGLQRLEQWLQDNTAKGVAV